MYNAALGAASRGACMSSERRLLSPPFVRVIAANFCLFLTFASFFLLPLHVRALGGSEQMIGLVMGTAGLAALAVVVVAGWLLDRFGRRPFLVGGLVAMSVSAAAFLAVDHIGPALFLLRVVQGLAFAAGFNAASTLAVELAPLERRAAALGLFGVSTLTTHALAPALGEVLVARAGRHLRDRRVLRHRVRLGHHLRPDLRRRRASRPRRRLLPRVHDGGRPSRASSAAASATPSSGARSSCP
jgi:MFS family permease